MRGKTAALAALTAGAFSLWGAGCGGGDATTSDLTSTPTTTSAVSTEEFITAADARCAEANAAIANLDTEGSDSAAALEQQQSITEETVKGLKALGSPEDPDGSLDDYYSAVKEEISVLSQQQAALASGDTATSDSLQVQLDQAQSDARDAAESFGFEECGQQGTAISSDTTSATPPPDSGVTTTPTSTTPTTTPVPAPTPPATPAPAPPSGGTSGGTGTGGGTSGGTGGGNSGGISPGG